MLKNFDFRKIILPPITDTGLDVAAENVYINFNHHIDVKRIYWHVQKRLLVDCTYKRVEHVFVKLVLIGEKLV